MSPPGQEDSKVSKNNGGPWAITTFAMVIVALGSGGWSQTNHQAYVTKLADSHQAYVTQLLNGFQTERVIALDTLLQKEVEKEAELVVSQFQLAERESKNRHEQQQAQIDEIKSWFKPPELRRNGSMNNK